MDERSGGVTFRAGDRFVKWNPHGTGLDLEGSDGSLAAHVDLGSLGVADRWADLAVASMNLTTTAGRAGEDAFFEAYGIARDEERVLFYRFLWENEDRVGVELQTE
jgi:hypothetical protein